MKPDDKEIWRESLDDKTNVNLFNVKPDKSTLKPPKRIFKNIKEKKLEARLLEIEKTLDNLTKTIENVKRISMSKQTKR